MKYLFTITALLLAHLSPGQSNVQDKKAEKTGNDTVLINSNYDKDLAKKLGADDYGMKSYFLVILKTGTNTTTNKELINEYFRGHLDNINRLA